MKVLTSSQTPQNTVALINLASLVDELYYIAFLFKFFYLITSAIKYCQHLLAIFVFYILSSMFSLCLWNYIHI